MLGKIKPVTKVRVPLMPVFLSVKGHHTLTKEPMTTKKTTVSKSLSPDGVTLWLHNYIIGQTHINRIISVSLDFVAPGTPQRRNLSSVEAEQLRLQ